MGRSAQLYPTRCRVLSGKGLAVHRYSRIEVHRQLHGSARVPVRTDLAGGLVITESAQAAITELG